MGSGDCRIGLVSDCRGRRAAVGGVNELGVTSGLVRVNTGVTDGGGETTTEQDESLRSVLRGVCRPTLAGVLELVKGTASCNFNSISWRNEVNHWGCLSLNARSPTTK